MGLIGGSLGYNFLKKICKDGETAWMDGSAYADKSKLETLLGAEFFNLIEDRIVVDFGCGLGLDSIEMAQRGARRVIGIDIQERFLSLAREQAKQSNVGDRCTFSTSTDVRADVLVSVDTFEHFDDPAAVLRTMHEVIKPDGCAIVAFGCTWYHPFGGHLFSVFPWAHLVFTEESLIRWRSDFASDGARRFGEVDGGLNQMTIRRFERIVSESPFRFEQFEALPIRKLRLLANRMTREFTTTVVRCKLVPRG